MKPEKRKEYEQSLKYYRDWMNTLDTAEAKGLEEGLELGKEQGLEEGLEQGLELGKKAEKIKIAKISLKQNIDIETIALITRLDREEIKNLELDN